MSKVEDKRDELIEKSAKRDEWDEVLRLLDHPLANAERKDRAYGLLSLHWNIGTADNLQIELGDEISDSSLNPLESLIQSELKKEQVNPFTAFQTFDEIDRVGHNRGSRVTNIYLHLPQKTKDTITPLIDSLTQQ